MCKKKRRDGFNILQIEMNYTGEMEKAMQQSHGLSYSEYNRSLEKRMEVEKVREKDYEKSMKIAAQFQNR